MSCSSFRLGLLFVLALLPAGCCSTGGPGPPTRRDQLSGVWIATGYEDSVRRLVLLPDGTGSLSTVLLQEIAGVPRVTRGTFSSSTFDETKGVVLIKCDYPRWPGYGTILSLRGWSNSAQLEGSVWTGTPAERVNPAYILFVRESAMLEALKLSSGSSEERAPR